MWPYGFVVGPAITFIGTGIVLVSQGVTQAASYSGWALIGLGCLTLLLSLVKYRVEKDDRDNAFYRVLPSGEVKALFTYPEYRRFPQKIRVQLLRDGLVDRWIRDEISRRATKFLASPRMAAMRDWFRAFFEQ